MASILLPMPLGFGAQFCDRPSCHGCLEACCIVFELQDCYGRYGRRGLRGSTNRGRCFFTTSARLRMKSKPGVSPAAEGIGSSRLLTRIHTLALSGKWVKEVDGAGKRDNLHTFGSSAHLRLRCYHDIVVYQSCSAHSLTPAIALGLFDVVAMLSRSRTLWDVGDVAAAAMLG
ncbi:hypothetical protein P280DRAFT_240169 [Massarina eburnea CBS 473.64]|uniref:Uncharacterized protein n=1 Tax=Massarina eburnea CBS 473.64 TaxID=1395130 RepID=A0A6A6S6M7_9PLEO|nr:hypothetical protein P280DRAFT_240169 [Massarina eburnea CBS 473.64]